MSHPRSIWGALFCFILDIPQHSTRLTLVVQINMNANNKPYGPHSYPDHGARKHCLYRCGCWKEESNSGGPVGLDPDGECPNNPTSTQLSPKDYENVVNRRIAELKRLLAVAEGRLLLLDPSKDEMARTIIEQDGRIQYLENTFKEIHKLSALLT